MEFGGEVTDLAFMFAVAIAVGGLALAILFPFLNASVASKRVEQVAVGKKDVKVNSFRARFSEDQKDTRRRQIQDSPFPTFGLSKAKFEFVGLEAR